MRLNQVRITIERFGDEAPPRFGGHQVISVYADANDIYEALTAAFYEALEAIQEDARLPGLGRREHATREGDFSHPFARMVHEDRLICGHKDSMRDTAK